MIIKEHIIAIGNKKIYGKLYYPEKAKDRGLIICSHGFNGSGSDYDTDCRFYAENGYAAYAFDFCGGSNSSRSSGSTTEMTIFTERDELIEIIKQLRELDMVDKERVYLVGASQGGFVSALAAEDKDSNIEALALYFPAFIIPEDWRARLAGVTDIPEIVELWGVKLSREYYDVIKDFNTFDHIGKSYKNPVLIMSGDRDEIVPVSSVEYAAGTAYENGRLVVFEGERHGFSAEGSEKARNMILEFFSEN